MPDIARTTSIYARSIYLSLSIFWTVYRAITFGQCFALENSGKIVLDNYLRQRRRYMFLPLFVFLSVCLSVCLCVKRWIKNAYMDLDEMLRVDRCRDMDELINLEPDPDHNPDARLCSDEVRRRGRASKFHSLLPRRFVPRPVEYTCQVLLKTSAQQTRSLDTARTHGQTYDRFHKSSRDIWLKW